MDAMTSMIFMVPFNWAPNGWMSCQGQILNVQQYQGVFSLIVNTYGGDITKGTFALPNLSGRTAIGAGRSTITPSNQYTVAQVYGTETMTLAAANMPPHVHPATFAPTTGSQSITIPAQPGTLKVQMNALSATGSATGGVPSTSVMLGNNGQTRMYGAATGTPTPGTTALADGAISVTGAPALPQQTVSVNTVTGGTVTVGPNSGGTPFSTFQPSLALNFIITMFGLYPGRPE